MRPFRIILALVITLGVVAYFVLIPRNEFSWMTSDLPANGGLPVDDLQGMKETVSIVLLVLGLSVWGAVALTRRSAVAIAGAVLGAAVVLGAWRVLFWSM